MNCVIQVWISYRSTCNEIHSTVTPCSLVSSSSLPYVSCRIHRRVCLSMWSRAHLGFISTNTSVLDTHSSVGIHLWCLDRRCHFVLRCPDGRCRRVHRVPDFTARANLAVARFNGHNSPRRAGNRETAQTPLPRSPGSLPI